MAADATTPTTKPAAEHHGATAEGRRTWYLLREAPSREFESGGHVDLDRVVVMTDGDIVESGPADALFADPRHPYTRDLLAAAPALRT